MRKLFLAALFAVSLPSFAQIAVVKADGTKINASSVEFNHEDEKIIYSAPGVKKEKIKYKELTSVTSNDYKFKIFKGGEFKGYFIKSETATWTLCYLAFTLTAGPSTGFQSSFDHADVAVFDNNGKLIEEVDMRQGKSGKNDKIRGSVVPLIKKHFSDCPKLMAEISKYENDDKDNMQIFYYFRRTPDYIECK